MPNASAYKRAASKFDPCSIFPARVHGKKMIALEQEKGHGIGGATDLKNNTVYLPTENTAYHRTIRLHEALHAIYTPESSNPEDFNMLGQALEDARLHLNCAKTEGQVRRDELCTALTDLRKGGGKDKNLAALLALRSAAILQSHPEDLEESKHWPRASKMLKRLCEQVSSDYGDTLTRALDSIQRNAMAEAKELLKPYFDSSKSEEEIKRSGGTWKNGKPDKDKKEGAGDMPSKAVTFAQLDGKLSSEAVDMLSERTVAEMKGKDCPILNINHLFATGNIPTYFGEDHKHTLSGSKIDAKKLASIVGPSAPRLFLKTIRRNGGTVVIDASGSMHLTDEQLLRLCTIAPLATVGFYNGLTDDTVFHAADGYGNLWLFSYKGKRAADLSEVKKLSGSDYESKIYTTATGKRREKTTLRESARTKFSSGNLVDLQVIQWMLDQPAPRYIFTDGGFTGPTAAEARELLHTAIARKKLIQVTSLGELERLLSKGINAGRVE